MDWLQIGNSGLKVTQITYGTALTIGVENNSKEFAKEMIDTAWSLGIRSFDTADSYGEGNTELLLGYALQNKPRDEFVLSSKTGQQNSNGPFGKGLSRKHIISNIDKTLEHLQTPYIDLYYAHRPDPEVNILEIARTFNDLIRQGKILHWGTSEWSVEQLQELFDICDKYNLEKPITEQAIHSFAVQKVYQNGVYDFCKSNNLGLFGYSPLCQGFLTGKYQNGIPENSRIAKSDQLNYNKTKNFYEQYKERIDHFLKICKKFDVNSTHVALLYSLRQGILPILGSSKPEQLVKNIDGLFDLEKKLDLTFWQELTTC